MRAVAAGLFRLLPVVRVRCQSFYPLATQREYGGGRYVSVDRRHPNPTPRVGPVRWMLCRYDHDRYISEELHGSHWHLPIELFDRLGRGEVLPAQSGTAMLSRLYEGEEDGLADLSDAMVAFGRDAAGLPAVRPAEPGPLPGAVSGEISPIAVG
jgi:hypothetical protein